MLRKCWLSYFLKLLSMAYKRAEERVYICSCQHLKILLIFGLVKNTTFATSGKTVLNSPLTSADLQIYRFKDLQSCNSYTTIHRINVSMSAEPYLNMLVHVKLLSQI